MTAKEFLKQYRRETERVIELNQSIAELEQQIDSISINLDGMPHGTKISNNTQDLALRLAERKALCENMTACAVLIREEVMDAIHKVDDPVLARLLYLRYIEGASWKDIAEDLHYDDAYVRSRLHSKALAQIASQSIIHV
ncbi:MAG: hypothetical protein II464_07780 [Oscillospiraceae bacterium]|nr:hypothetical protein [Oscillospiraceae bacterium]